MKYTRLGRSGLKVSRLCLGCMTFGDPGRGRHAWTLPPEDSYPIIREALEAGINFFDTANTYSDGTSEEILGQALRDFARRDEVVVATKVYVPMRTDANARGLSRKAIMREIDASLRRLGTDYVDLYQIHRYDEETPIEETLEALNDVVRAGKALYVGASSMFAWQLARMLAISERRGWSRFVSMQNHYNLLYREEEREMLPLCQSEGLGIIPWSPMARGLLTRPWSDEPQTERANTDAYLRHLYERTRQDDREIVMSTAAVADELGIAQASLALAWVLANPVVTAPIIGVRSKPQLDAAIAALDVEIPAELRIRMESPYRPRPVAGID